MSDTTHESVANQHRRRFPRVSRAVPTVFVLSLIGSLFAACGGASGPGVASAGSHVGTTSPSSAPAGNSGGPISPTMAKAQLAYSVCMQKHGMPSFPDPNAGGGYRGKPPWSTTSSVYVHAAKDCSYLAKSAGMVPWTDAQWTAYDAQLLKISECMRAHGITNFPDPYGGHKGGWPFTFPPSSSSPFSAPGYSAAAKACDGPPPPTGAPR